MYVWLTNVQKYTQLPGKMIRFLRLLLSLTLLFEQNNDSQANTKKREWMRISSSNPTTVWFAGSLSRISLSIALLELFRKNKKKKQQNKANAWACLVAAKDL